MHLLALGHYLYGCASTCTDACSDSRALAPTRNRPNDRAGNRANSHFLRRVRPARGSGYFVVTSHDRLETVVDKHVGQLKLELRLALEMSRLLRLGQPAIYI